MQQRLLLERMGSSGSKNRRVNEVSSHTGGSVSEGGSPNTEWFSIGDDFGQVDSVSHEKCQKARVESIAHRIAILISVKPSVLDVSSLSMLV